MTSSIEHTYGQALFALQAGRFDDAERLFKRTLHLHPRHVGSLNLYSILLTKTKRFEEAEQYIKRALIENETSDASFYNYGVILKALKRPEEALKQFNKALAIKPSVADTLNARGDILIDLKQYDKAIADFDKALAFNPKFIDALVNKARALAELEDYEPALSTADHALSLQPHHALAWLCRGNILIALERFNESLEAFSQSLTINPQLAEAWCNRGNSYAAIDRYKDALECFDRALALKPEFLDAIIGRGDALQSTHNDEEALTAFDKVIELEPNNTTAWLGRSKALAALNRYDKSLAAIEQALDFDSNSVEAHESLGLLLMQLDRPKEAEVAFRKAIDLQPNNAMSYYNLVGSKKFTLHDPDLAAIEAMAAKSGELSKREQKFLQFALGKVYDSLGDYRRSFQHMLAGNAAERATIDYDENSSLAYFDDIEKIFTHELIVNKSGLGETSSIPIFIIGMPRSGSTLLEQILVSHPAVAAAGEVSAFRKAVDRKRVRYPTFVPMLDDAMLKSIGKDYIERLCLLAPEGKRKTDKMLGNFFYLGLIHLVLPHAVILHSVRDPIDTCISCFSMKFQDQHYYTYDLAELGRYYVRYQQLMEHWHRVLPPNRILDVKYEEVITDLEGQARRIIAHCGLDWDDRCLSFHKTERPVRTASLTQVRQPIYSSSVGRWHAYEEFLTPLLKELGIEDKTTTM